MQGEGELTAANGFANQGDVLINTRLAADKLGPTNMDRPEDIEVNPANGRVYIMLTNNTRRGNEGQPGPNAANPRAPNRYGHVIELREDMDNPNSPTFTWEIFLLCGDPDDPDVETYYGGADKADVSGIAAPDNCTFDNAGNLWISTDGQPGTLGGNDSIYMVPVEGPYRGAARRFFNGIPGGEICGPEFTPANTTLFAAIQHPGARGSFAEPQSYWPDNQQPPRPSVVAIVKNDGGIIGS